MTLESFIAEHKISMTADRASSNPNINEDEAWAASARHYRCILRRNHKRLTILFSQGCAITHEPTAADVLDCLASDSAGLENNPYFEDWCAEYGYNADSLKTLKLYKACVRQAKQLRRFLGGAFETLLWDTERR